MKKVLDDVRAFHEACDLPVLVTPAIPSAERIRLRCDLLEEEVFEFFAATDNHDLPAIADALADLIYVIAGTAHEFGIPLEEVWDEVQRANMAKVDPVTGKVRKREDGKVLKPKGWTPPDIEAILKRFGYDSSN